VWTTFNSRELSWLIHRESIASSSRRLLSLVVLSLCWLILEAVRNCSRMERSSDRYTVLYKTGRVERKLFISTNSL
jgi:hypothetical protein